MGAVFTSALQLSVALGLSILTSITTSINKKQIDAGKPVGYKGVAASYWFLFAFLIAEAVALLVFYKVTPKPITDTEAPEEQLSATSTLTPEEGQAVEKKVSR